MSEIQAVKLNKFFGDFHLLSDISFDIESGERVGLVGPNGCGKTTMLKIISGSEGYDSGSLIVNRRRRTGLLEQLPEYPPQLTVRQVLFEAFEPIERMGEQLALLESEMANGKAIDLNAYGTLQTAFENAGGYDLELKYNKMTAGMNIPPDMQERPFMSLSGGEKTRVNLARIMLGDTDILLLDEPTNHLDIDSVEWVEEYLKTFKGAVLIVSHDRYFLDKVTTRTLEINDGQVTSWAGNYSFFVEKKQELAAQLELAAKRQEKEINRLQTSADRMKIWGLGNKKVMKKAFNIERRIERIERIKTIRKQRSVKGGFNIAARSGDEVMVLEGLSVGHDEQAPLVTDFSAMVFRGERIAILGANGTGKTTLLESLLRNISLLSGDIYIGTGVKTGYLPQQVVFDRPDRNMVDTMLYATNCSTQEARDRLAAYEFRGEEVFKEISVLSGGERTRLKLCMFMYDKINTLLLDEPTNHLDILSRQWVEDAIDDFSETMLFVSHDRYFIDRFATRIWMLEDGKITDYIGTYEEYRAHVRTKKQVQSANRERERKQNRQNASDKSLVGANSKARAKILQEKTRAAQRLEQSIAKIDEQMAQCSAEDYVRLGELFESKQQLELELLELYEQIEQAD